MKWLEDVEVHCTNEIEQSAGFEALMGPGDTKINLHGHYGVVVSFALCCIHHHEICGVFVIRHIGPQTCGCRRVVRDAD